MNNFPIHVLGFNSIRAISPDIINYPASLRTKQGCYFRVYDLLFGIVIYCERILDKVIPITDNR